MNNKCFILLKPDAILRGLVGEIISRIERTGLMIIKMSTIRPSKQTVEEHYKHIDPKIVNEIVEYFINTEDSGGTALPLIAIVVFGQNAIEVCRKLIGDRNPIVAAPGTIRGDFSNESFEMRSNMPLTMRATRNLIHVSDSMESFHREVAIWFKTSLH